VVVVHLLYRLDVGGLETVVVNLINHLPPEQYRHVVVSLTQCSDFKERIHHPGVTFYELNKKEGKDWAVWGRLWRLLRQLKPDILHTCNLAALEGVVPARLAGVPVVIHAEHGRDGYDLDGSNWKYLLLRRLLLPLVDRVIPVSEDLKQWLCNRVHVPESKIQKIINGIDSPLPPRTQEKFQELIDPQFAPPGSFIIATVGRLWPVKDQANLLHAFAHLLTLVGEEKKGLRLVLVGDGPQRGELEQLAQTLQIEEKLWISGWRKDVPELLRAVNLFALPSLAEGTPLTILEAMAAGLPVVATQVGGVEDLVIGGETGSLVPAQKPQALALALLSYVKEPKLARLHGLAGRDRYENKFTLEQMVHHYNELFEGCLRQKKA
jgi:sugar transferase (PEP-CTERM/EpsH1 system associated)